MTPAEFKDKMWTPPEAIEAIKSRALRLVDHYDFKDPEGHKLEMSTEWQQMVLLMNLVFEAATELAGQYDIMYQTSRKLAAELDTLKAKSSRIILPN
jgi:hypothetical protein